jgi:N-dimethylarginine dimethylaminohydrolase
MDGPDRPDRQQPRDRQWTKLRDAYLELGHTVDEIEPIPGLPDMVFAANGATVIDGIAYGAQFRHPERAAEAPAYRNWLDGAGFETHDAKSVNEGEGDLLLTERFLLAGTGFRTDQAAHAEAQELFGRPVVTLQLVDPRFYHLDTALACSATPVAFYPEAFSPGSAAGRAPDLPGRHRGHAATMPPGSV